jgi:hypothetical protein
MSATYTIVKRATVTPTCDPKDLQFNVSKTESKLIGIA